MGRRKIEMVKLASETQRNVTYRKRSKGLIKKAREISVLTDVDVSLIMFSTTGKLDTFSSQRGIWKMLQRFIHNIPDNERRLISQDNINKINMLAQQNDSANRQPNTEANKKKIMDDDTRKKLLEFKNRLMDPSREAFKSQQQFAGLLQSLENIRQTVVNKRMQMQQGLAAENGEPQQVQEQIQHPGAEILVGNPSPSLNSAQNVEQNATGSPFIDMSVALHGEQQEWLLEDIMDSQFLLPVKSEPVSINTPEFISDPIPEEYQQQNMLQGMDFSGGLERTYGQPSASLWDTILNATEPGSTRTAQENPETLNKEAGDNAIIFPPHTLMPMQEYQGEPEAGFWIPQQGGDHTLQQGIKEFGMENLSSASVPVYGAQQNAWTADYEQSAWN